MRVASYGSCSLSIVVLKFFLPYSQAQGAEPHGDSGDWVARAGLFAGCGEPRGRVHAERFAARWDVDPGVSARDMVTELRQAHGSVRVTKTRH